MSELLSVADATQKLLTRFSPLQSICLPLDQARNQVCAQEIRASFDLPRFSNSSMDGFAVRSSDLAGANLSAPVTLQVVADIPAGKWVDVELSSQQAARIMTGAPIPAGSDAVVPVEATDFKSREAGRPAPSQVRIFTPPSPGDNVRYQSSDVKTGDLILPKGRRLQPQDLGMIAMFGMRLVQVFRRPRVAVISTGDELQSLDTPLAPGKIYDSNSAMLAALVEKYGGESLHFDVAPDDAAAIQAMLEQAVQAEADLIVSSAGVSVGAFDYVREVVENNGRLEFWRVNVRPGKPLAFGEYRQTPFIGLPGNPVSAFVTFELFVRPAILKMKGLTGDERRLETVILTETVESDGRESYLRAVAAIESGDWVARLAGHQGSGNLFSLVQANALLIIPAGVSRLAAGSQAQVWLL